MGTLLFGSDEVMNGLDALFADEDPMSPGIITALAKIEGKPDLENLKREINKRVLMKRNSRGELKYGRLRKYHFRKYGYYFLKYEDPFDLSHHIYEVSPRNRNRSFEDAAMSVIESLTKDHFHPVVSPWDVVLITQRHKEDDQPEYYYIAVRMHHAIADGASMVYMLLNDIVDQKDALPLHDMVKTYHSNIWLKWGQVQNLVKGILFWPYFLAKQFLFHDVNSLHGSVFTGKKLCIMSDELSLQRIKNLKNETKTTVSSIIISCLLAAFSKYFERTMDKIPSHMKLMLPFLARVPRETDDLSNYAVGVFESFPVGKMNLRLRSSVTHEVYEGVKASTSLTLNSFLSQSLMNTSPPWFSSLISRTTATAIITNVPGPQQELTLWGDKLKELVFWPPNKGQLGMSISIISYMDRIRVGMLADEGIVKSNESLQFIMYEFMKQIDDLEKQLQDPL